jgi:hypothetical protein
MPEETALHHSFPTIYPLLRERLTIDCVQANPG